MPTIGVYIVIFNELECVKRAIESVILQTYDDLDVWLLDDGSDAETRDFLDMFAETSPRFNVIHFGTTPEEKRQLCSYARNINTGVGRSNASYLSFLAGDDYYHPDRMDRMMTTLDHDEGIHVAYGSQERPNANGRFVAPLATEVIDYAFNRVDMSSVVMCRHVFEEAQGFPDAYEDWGDADGRFWQRVNALGYRFHPVDDPERYTDAKPYRDGSVQERWNKGMTPWE